LVVMEVKTAGMEGRETGPKCSASWPPTAISRVPNVRGWFPDSEAVLAGPSRHLPGLSAQWSPVGTLASLPLRGQRRHQTGFPIIPSAIHPKSTLNAAI